MKVLITGGAGYVGTSLVDALMDDPRITGITILDNLTAGDLRFFFHDKKQEKLRFVKGDILDDHSLKMALQDAPDTILHLAAFTAQPFNHLQHLQYEQINRWGTQNVVRHANDTPSVQRLLFLSSTAVYGFREDIRPQDSPAPENAYALSKSEAEKYVSLFRGEQHILRASNVFGYNRRWRTDAVIHKFISDALITGRITLHGNGEQFRPFVSIGHLARQIGDWVLQGSDPGQLAFEFNASMNQIRDQIIESLPGMEYTHLSHQQAFPSQRILREEIPHESTTRLLGETITAFKDRIILT